MAEPKWTPGLWGLNKYGSVGAGAGNCCPIIASVEPFYGVDERFGSHAANARLIAAAPELYEALEECETIMMIVQPRSHTKEYLAGLEQAQIALAKARGETP